MHKIETHLHTKHVSKCGWLDAASLVAGYKAAGYSGIIVTDHYNRITFDYLGLDLSSSQNKVRPFLEGYYRMAEEGEKQDIRIYKGAEIRFDECENDYLLYGYRDDLLSDPEAIFRMGIAAFSPIARGQGALIVQAHPYRGKCTPAIACYLDGIEVRNLNPRHESHNAWAAEYAERFGLLKLAGSDCHRTEDVAATGILSDEVPEDPMGMVRLIRSRRYSLI